MARQLARKSILGLSTNLLVTVFGFISMVFVKRYMGYETIGMLAFALAYVHLYAVIADLGFGMAHIKRVNEDGVDEGICNGTLLSVKLLLNFIMITVVLTTILVPKYLFGYEYESKTFELILYLTVLKVFFDNIIATFKNIYSGKLEVAKVAVPRISGRFLQTVMKSSIAILGFSAVYLVGAEIIIGVFIILIFLVLFQQSPLKRPNLHYFKLYAAFAFPLIFIEVVAIFAQNMDKVMIQFLTGSSATVGIYTIPQRISAMFLIISSVVTGLLFPAFSGLYSRRDFKSIEKLTNEAVKYVSMTLIPAMVFLFVFAEPLMTLVFGSDAVESVVVLQIFLVAVYINALRRPYSTHIVATGHMKLAFSLSVITLGINFILNMIFIPDEVLGITMLGLGAEGAALTTLVSLSVSMGFAKYYAFKLTKTRGYRRIWRHLVAGAASGGVAYLMLVLNDAWYLLGVYFVVILGLYMGIMYLLKELRKKEITFYLNAVHPGKMKNYMVDELKGKK